MTVNHLVKTRRVQKTVGDLLGEPDQSAETDLLLQLDECERAYREAFAILADAKARLVGSLSREAKASLAILGRKANEDVSRLGVVKFELEKRLNAVRGRTSKTAMRKGLDDAVRELGALRKRADDVRTGREKVNETQRRDLVRDLSRAEVRVAEFAR